jgi:hypothetical protein
VNTSTDILDYFKGKKAEKPMNALVIGTPATFQQIYLLKDPVI